MNNQWRKSNMARHAKRASPPGQQSVTGTVFAHGAVHPPWFTGRAYAPNGNLCQWRRRLSQPTERPRRRHQWRQDRMEVEIAYATDRGVERGERLKGGHDLRLCLCRSHRHYRCPHGKGSVDKIPAQQRLRADRERRRQCRPMVVSDPGHLLGRWRHPDRVHRQGTRRMGQAQGQEDRRCLP